MPPATEKILTLEIFARLVSFIGFANSNDVFFLFFLRCREDGTLFERMNDFLDKWVRNDLRTDFSSSQVV